MKPERVEFKAPIAAVLNYALAAFFWCAGLAVILMGVIQTMAEEGPLPSSWVGPTLTVVWATPLIVGVVVAVRSNRLRLKFDEEGVTVVGFRRTWQASWQAITRATVSLFYPVLQLETANQTFKVFAVPQSTFFTKRLAQIDDVLASHGIDRDIRRLHKWRRPRWLPD